MKGSHPTRARGRRVRNASAPLPEADYSSWEKSLDRLSGAYAENTLKGYECDFRYFLNWCLDHLPPLPATPFTVAQYLAAVTKRFRPSSLKRRMAGIRKIHWLFDLPDPTDTLEVDLAFRRARRRKPQRPNQALGVTAAIRDRLLGGTSHDLIGLRDRVMISIGFDTLCRRSELNGVQILPIMRAGGWRSFNVVARYIENVEMDVWSPISRTPFDGSR